MHDFSHLLPAGCPLAVHDEASRVHSSRHPNSARHLDARRHCIRAFVRLLVTLHLQMSSMQIRTERSRVALANCTALHCADLLGGGDARDGDRLVLRDRLVQRHSRLRDVDDRAAGAVLGAYGARPAAQPAHDLQAVRSAAQARAHDDERAGHNERVRAAPHGSNDLDFGAQLGAVPAVRRHLAHVQLLLGAQEDERGAVRDVPARGEPRAHVHPAHGPRPHLQLLPAPPDALVPPLGAAARPRLLHRSRHQPQGHLVRRVHVALALAARRRSTVRRVPAFALPSALSFAF